MTSHQRPRHARRARRGARPWVAVVAATAFLATAGAGLIGEPSTDVGAAAAAPRAAEPRSALPPKAPSADWHAWGPSRQEVREATQRARDMSDEELAGQLIVGRLHGTGPDDARTLVSELHLAGVMVTGQSVVSLPQVQALSAAVHETVAAGGRGWPGLVSTDNEGGAVQRMSGRVGRWTTFPPLAEVGRIRDADLVREAYAAMGAELRASGVTVNWAPVVDVTVPGEDAIIRSRSAGADTRTVARTAVPVLQGFLDAGVLPSAKHFPGHGALDTDSHHGLPVLTADDAQLAVRELPPFRAAVQAGVPMVMLAHVDVQEWDPGLPASVSPEAYRVLREELGFAGVTVTDSLGMGALNDVGDAGEVAVAALAAGADLLLNPADNHDAHAGVVAALEDGTLERSAMEEAAGRVIAMLRHQQQLAAAAGPAEVGDAAGAAQALWDAAARSTAPPVTDVPPGDADGPRPVPGRDTLR